MKTTKEIKYLKKHLKTATGYRKKTLQLKLEMLLKREILKLRLAKLTRILK